MATRTARPSAQKRPKVVAPLDEAQRVLRRVFQGDDGIAEPPRRPTEEIPVIPPDGTGVERPVPEWVDLNQSLERSFAFVDLCGFTRYTETHGAHAATDVLTRFRAACRDVATRRGARIGKWLGDGAMIVGTEPGPILAAAAEILLRFRDDPFEVHAGVASGMVLLFEGDDYIGRPVNLASRLCDAAGPGELLAIDLDEHVPEWVTREGTVTVRATGVGDLVDVAQLRVDHDAWAPTESSLSEAPEDGEVDPGDAPARVPA